MSVTQEAYVFGSPSHGDAEFGPYELPIETGQWFGVAGESHLIGKHYGRMISLRCMLTGFATATTCADAIDAIKAKEGTLTGTLVIVTPSGMTRTLTSCTFIRGDFESPINSQPWSGTPWCAQGVLLWRSRNGAQ